MFTRTEFGPGRLGAPSVGWHPAAAATETAALHSPAPDEDGLRGNPLLAFGVIAAAAFGLMAFSTSVRVGKATGTVSIGTTK